MIELRPGALDEAEGVGAAPGIEACDGPFCRVGCTVHEAHIVYADPGTMYLHRLADSYASTQRLRKAEHQRLIIPALQLRVAVKRGDPIADFLGVLEQAERMIAAQLTKELRAHVLWPWLSQYPGLCGVHTASIMGRMHDPRRFPGARSLWHYAGLHVVDGRLPRKVRGLKSTWNGKLRTAVLQPGGIAEQIVRLRVPHYRELYDAAKARIARERGVIGAEGVEMFSVIERRVGASAPVNGVACGKVERPPVIEAAAGLPHANGNGTERVEAGTEIVVELGPLRPVQIESRARIIAAKAFVADLWRAWRDLLGDAPPVLVAVEPDDDEKEPQA